MARPRLFDEATVLDAAMQTFWDRGYEGTSVADLVDSTGLNRASLYGTFGTKHDLLLAALTHYECNRVTQMLAPLRSGGLGAVIGFFEQFPMVSEQWPERAVMGCMIVNSAVESSVRDPEIEVVASRYTEELRSAFEHALDVAIEKGEMFGSAPARADQLSLMAFGLFVMLRAGASTAEVIRLVGSIIEQVESWRSPGPETR